MSSIFQDIFTTLQVDKKKENLKPLIERVNANDVCWLKKEEEINEMLDNYITILKLRGKEL